MKTVLSRLSRLERRMDTGTCRCAAGGHLVAYPLPDGSDNPDIDTTCLTCGGQRPVIQIRYVDSAGKICPPDDGVEEHLRLANGLTRVYPTGF